MKRIILITLAICLTFSFVSCGNDDDEQLVERSIDGVAAYLGYTDGVDIDLSEDMDGTGAKPENTSRMGKYIFTNLIPTQAHINIGKVRRTRVWEDLYCYLIQILMKNRMIMKS